MNDVAKLPRTATLVLATAGLIVFGCAPKNPGDVEDAEKGAAGGTPPNIVLVMTDDMGYGQTGYYGHPLLKTPHLDAMAEGGLRLDRFYAGAPSCTPTRASVLTGRTNDRTGARRVGDSINKQEQMLSTAFKRAGYATGHFGKWHLNMVGAPDEDPLPKSDPHNPSELGFDYWLSHTEQFNLDPILSRNGIPEQFSGDSSEVLVKEALHFIQRETAGAKPVFVVIWTSSPHRIFEASEEDAAPFTDLDPGSRDHHGEIVAIDRSIGTLRQGLRELNLERNTLVWFKSDNGGIPNIDYGPEHLGVHPDTSGHLRGFKKDFYEGGLRVPGIIEWPGTIPPRVSQFPASTMDIFPTLVDVANLDPRDINPVHDGISIAEVFVSEPDRREQPIGFRASGGLAWLDNDYKLVKNYWPKDAEFELYNVASDPAEEHDLMDQEPERAARMKGQLDVWNRSVDQSITGADYPEGEVLPSGREPTLATRAREQPAGIEDEVATTLPTSSFTATPSRTPHRTEGQAMKPITIEFERLLAPR